MKAKQTSHKCVYGVLTDGGEITEDYIGLLLDYLDRRKGLATHYNYCPYCGKKLDYKKIKQIAKKYEERYFNETI